MTEMKMTIQDLRMEFNQEIETGKRASWNEDGIEKTQYTQLENSKENITRRKQNSRFQR